MSSGAKSKTLQESSRSIPISRLIFLDESDALTQEAQQAMRRTMEKYTSTTRFILSCNYSSKTDSSDTIQRCAIFRFKPLTDSDVENEDTPH